MRPVICLVLIATLTTTGCARIADSRLNPLNLFKGDGGPRRDAAGNVEPLVTQGDLQGAVDTRPLIATVDTIELERLPFGVVLRATGQAAGQGYYNAGLVPVAADGDTLVYEFRARAPATPPAALRAQRITVATIITSEVLAGKTAITVMGAQTGRSLRP